MSDDNDSTLASSSKGVDRAEIEARQSVLKAIDSSVESLPFKLSASERREVCKKIVFVSISFQCILCVVPLDCFFCFDRQFCRLKDFYRASFLYTNKKHHLSSKYVAFDSSKTSIVDEQRQKRRFPKKNGLFILW
jgi:hypothetical protein